MTEIGPVGNDHVVRATCTKFHFLKFFHTVDYSYGITNGSHLAAVVIAALPLLVLWWIMLFLKFIWLYVGGVVQCFDMYFSYTPSQKLIVVAVVTVFMVRVFNRAVSVNPIVLTNQINLCLQMAYDRYSKGHFAKSHETFGFIKDVVPPAPSYHSQNSFTPCTIPMAPYMVPVVWYRLSPWVVL